MTGLVRAMTGVRSLGRAATPVGQELMMRERGDWDDLDLDRFEDSGYEQQRAELDAWADHRAATLEQYRRLVDHLRERATSSGRSQELYEVALSHLHIDELTHLDLINVARLRKHPIIQADSYFRNVVVRRRKKQLGLVPEKYLGISKDRDGLFGDIVGVRTPKVLFTGTLDEIRPQLRQDVVLKPLESRESQGAFYVFDETNIFSISESRRLTGWAELPDAISTQLGVDSPGQVTMQAQELIYESEGTPARDMKFYAFYGEIGLIIEVSRYPTQQYAFFDADLSAADVGQEHHPRFEDRALTITDKGGLSHEKLETVRRMSQAIPAPFMRIDFLNVEHELVFCEFSGAPGLSHTFNETYDRLLGRYYNEAEIRLVNDLVAGKQFGFFQVFSEQVQALRGNG